MVGRRFFCIFAAVAAILAAGIVPAASDELAQLKWPQSFTLEAGDKTSFGFPLTQAGAITVDISWTGTPLDLGLVGPAGRAVIPVQRKTSPVRVTYQATAADVASGVLWKLTVAVPAGATGKPAAKGQISITYPEFDAAKVNAIASQSLAARTAAKASVRSIKWGGATGRDAGRAKLDADLEAKLTSQFTAISEKTQTLRLAAIKTAEAKEAPKVQTSMASRLTPAGLAGRIKAPPTMSTEPTIDALTPDHGFTGDRITISTRNFRANTTENHAWFRVQHTNPAMNSVVPTPILSATPNGNTVDFVVKVPEFPGFPHPDKSTIEILTDYNQNVTPVSPDFTWDNVPLGTVTSFSPTTVGPGDTVTLTGTNFSSSTTVHFQTLDSLDVAGSYGTVLSPTKMTVRVPQYSAQSEFVGVIWMQTRVPNGTQVRDVRHGITMTSSIPVLSSMDRTTAQPKEALMLQGSGFVSGAKIVLKTSTGKEYTSYPSQATDTVMVGKVPDVPLVPMGGYSVTIAVVNPNGDTSNALQMQLKPIIDRVQFTDVNRIKCVQFAKNDGGDEYNIYDIAHVQAPGPVGVIHNSSFFVGHRGDDFFSINVNLKNGWRLAETSLYKAFNVHTWQPGDSGDVNIWSTIPLPTGGTMVQCHYWVDASNNMLVYYVSFWLEGPHGFPME